MLQQYCDDPGPVLRRPRYLCGPSVLRRNGHFDGRMLQRPPSNMYGTDDVSARWNLQGDVRERTSGLWECLLLRREPGNELLWVHRAAQRQGVLWFDRLGFRQRVLPRSYSGNELLRLDGAAFGQRLLPELRSMRFLFA